MKSAEDRHGCDAGYVLDGAMDRSVFAKSPQLTIISLIVPEGCALGQTWLDPFRNQLAVRLAWRKGLTR